MGVIIVMFCKIFGGIFLIYFDRVFILIGLMIWFVDFFILKIYNVNKYLFRILKNSVKR